MEKKITQENVEETYVDSIELERIDKFVCDEMARQIHRYIKAMKGSKQSYSQPMVAEMPIVSQDTCMTYARCMRLELPTRLFLIMNCGKPFAIIGKYSLQYEMLTTHRTFANV